MITPPGPSTEAVRELCEGRDYSVVRLLGRGGMGEIWVVRHRLLGREFALKVLHPRFGLQPKVIDRLRVEAQVTALLEHPNIVPVVDFWVDKTGRPCLVMELLSGRTLDVELRERGRLPPLEVADIGRQLLSALGAAHQKDIIHRDIKPENLFLDEIPGIGRRVKILDFGVARVRRDSQGHGLEPAVERTRTGALIGSPRYMSPEAVRGEPLDLRADIYSVGVTLYELLTGIGPFDAMPQPDEAPAPSSVVGSLAKPFDDILLRALEEDLALRYSSAGEFETALRALLPSQPSRRLWPQGRS